MITPAEALARLGHAGSEGRISASASANIRRWLTEAPFARYRKPAARRHRARTVARARRRLLRRARVWHRRPARQDVPGRHQCPQRADDRRERAGTGRLCDCLAREKARRRSCVIAHDTRHHSAEFARLCARVLAAAGFKVFLFKEPRSTPLLSFAVRHLHCDAGIMVTASHNPPSDNGFKCYGRSGGQVIPPDDAGIIACVAVGLGSRDPREAVCRSPGRRLDPVGRRRASISPISPRS